jgi:hypothetical protein
MNMTEEEKAIQRSKYRPEFNGDGLTHDEGDYNESEMDLNDEDGLDECGD